MIVSVNPTPESESVPPSETQAASRPPSPVVSKPATWPEWFGVVDLAIVVLVVIAAFGVASFAARNSDLWYHLAAGRLMAEGQSTFGVDPFSYATEGRTWVNHNWLWDRIAYMVYRQDASGAWLVGAKAVAYALAFVVLVSIRRSGAALWPWAVMAGLAVLAGGTFTQLRPFALNPLFVALALFVLFRLEWKTGSWRNPILLAVLFGIWANVDSCFVLGIAMLLLVLIGELIQSALLSGRRDEWGAFGPSPPVSGLVKALLLSAAACMANPHHIHVWQMPAEYGVGLPAAGMLKDSELIVAVLEPYSEPFWGNPSRGKNLNGAAYLLLFVLSALAMAISFGKLRIAHLFVWLLFGYLSLHQWMFILPFSLVSAAIASAYLNLWSSGIVLKSKDHPTSRAYLLGSGIGRLLTVALAVLMVPAAWPGWLHPQSNAVANPRRVAWTIEPDEGLVATAKTIQGWRERGHLTADVRGFTPNIDFANYLAYFAPSEKVFANGRFSYHAPELPDLLSARQALYFDPKPAAEGGVDMTLVLQAMENAKASYLAAVSQIVRIGADSTRTIETMPGWTVWNVGGRGIVAGPQRHTKVAYDPVVELLGPSVTALPDIVALPAPVPSESWLDDYMRRPKGSPSSTEDAYALLNYAQFIGQKSNFEHGQSMFASAAVIGVAAGQINRRLSDADLTTPILAVRAARVSLAENPDLPDVYLALSQIYSNPFLPELFGENPQMGRTGEKQLQYISALQRFLARMPKPEQCNKRQGEQGYFASEQLIQVYLQTRQFDLCRELCVLKKKYFGVGPGQDYRMQIAMAGQNAEKAKAINSELEGQIKRFDDLEMRIEKQIVDVNDQLRAKQLKGAEKFLAFAKNGLPGAAIKAFEDIAEGDYQKEFGQETVLVALTVVDLLTRAGWVERAGAQLERLVKSVEELAKDAKTEPNYAAELKAQVVEREYRLRVLEGNYRAAADALERANANRFKPFSPADIASSRPEVMETTLFFGWVPFIVTQQKAMQVNGMLAAESEFAFQRGLLAVYDGRPADAKTRFVQSLAPQGVKGIPLPWMPLAERFVAMIERANAGEKK